MIDLIEATDRLWRLHKRFVVKTGFDPGSKDDARFLTIALAGEIGEVANLIKKDWRGDRGASDQTGLIRAELGDVFVYWLLLVVATDHDPTEVVDEAVFKAAKRLAELEAERR